MKKFVVVLLSVFALNSFAFAGEKDSLKMLAERFKQYEKYLDSLEGTMRYETGKVILPNGTVELNIPAGFKYLNKEQSNFILTDLWNNPPQDDVLGMVFPSNATLSSDSTYAFVITFEGMGFVKDKDADDIDYDKLMSDMRSEEAAENVKRAQNGYDAIHVVGWAQTPYYDKVNKVMHWAKEFKFGDNEENTLNYDIRILGRKGVLSLNAVGPIYVLSDVKKDIDKILLMATFTAGNRYEDFNSKTDNVAAWTVGGLVAGKILAKAGALKFLKIIILGIVAAVGAAWKWITGRRKKKDEYIYVPTPAPADTEQPNP